MTWKHVAIAIVPMLGLAGSTTVWVLGEARAAAAPAMAVATAATARVDSAVTTIRTEEAIAHERIESSHKELGEKIDHLTDLLLTGQVKINRSTTLTAGGHR